MLDPQLDEQNPLTEPLLVPIEKEEQNASFTSTSSTPEEQEKCEAFGRKVFIATALAFSGFIIFLTNRAVIDHGESRDNATYFSGATFVIIATLMTMREIILHLYHWNNPRIQTYYICILINVPWMSIWSFCSLRFYEGEAYFEAAIDMYEAFTVYCYGHMLVEILGGEEATEELLKTKEPLNHRCCCVLCCKKWPMDETFLARLKWALNLLIITKVGHAVLIIILEPLEEFHNMKLAWNAFTFSSLIVAYFTVNGLYTLLMFYRVTHEELTEPKDWRPTPKLLSFKAIIFLSHLIGFVISILVSTGAIESAQGWDDDHVAAFLQNWCYCFLMVFISILNSFAYSYTDFLENNEQIDKNEECIEVDVKVEEKQGTVAAESPL